VRIVLTAFGPFPGVPNNPTNAVIAAIDRSHAYDHRVVDGALGGMFVRKVADYLEAFDINRTF